MLDQRPALAHRLTCSMISQNLLRVFYLFPLIAVTFALSGCGGGGGGSQQPAPPEPLDPIEIVSVNVSGNPATGNSSDCGETCVNMSDDGRYYVFRSTAEDIVSGDTNGVQDIFVRDMESGVTTLVSKPNLNDQLTLGTESDGTSDDPSISGDGRYVVFQSDATNLVLGDTNGKRDIFVHDTATGETVRVNLPNVADQGILGTEMENVGSSERGCISDDGRYVGFMTTGTNMVIGDINSVSDIFRHDRQTGETLLVSQHSNGSQGDGASFDCSISGDGSIISFTSHATNLVDGDTNGIADIFVRDLTAGTTERVSVDSSGTESTGSFGSINSHITKNGRFVSFYSITTNLVANDTNGHSDAFLHDRQTGETILASAPNLADQGTLGTGSNDGAQYPAVSDDGRYVVYSSNATNVILNDNNTDWDIFVFDTQTQVTARVNVDANGNEMTTGFVSDWAGISGDGRYINFYGSGAPGPNIVAGDTNDSDDAYRAPNPLYPIQ